MRSHKLEIIDVDHKRLEEVARRAEESLAPDDAELIAKVFASYEYVTGLIQDKSLSIARLQKLLFGAKTEKTEAVVGQADSNPLLTASGEPETVLESCEEKPAPKGHGRNAAEAYAGAERIVVPHASLEPGDPCPECGKGTVYRKPPAVVVRITGQAPLKATRYELEKLRCHLCGKIFKADLPPEAGKQKYDAKAGSMIALLKYGRGMPFNRLGGLQGNLEIPLPASTQWEVVKFFAPPLTPAYRELIHQAAQGDVLYNDDTTIKILDQMGKRQGEMADKSERTGLYTSGIIATKDGQRIALFFSGRKHAGENLKEVLGLRAAELEAPIQMCDALSRNLPGELKTILANCLAHARREFVEIHDRFPEACRHVLEAFRIIDHNDAIARRDKLSPEERLRFHQTQSEPTLTSLHAWLNQQFAEKRVEPNSALGGAIQYLLNHWEKLTLFLRKAGAPLDNNICERALKKAILHRKNAYFYKTQNGARVGDLYMSLIHTCELNQANAFDYLTSLLEHADAVTASPECWMPWNYRQALGELTPASS
jgi:transposase